MANFFKVVLLFFFSTLSLFLSAQNEISLNEKFRKYEVVQLDSRQIYQEITTKRNSGQITLHLNDQLTWDLSLVNSNLVSKDYVLNVGTEEGVKTFKGTTAIPMNGVIANNSKSRVSLTFNHDFIYGFIQDHEDMYFVEPLRHYSSKAQVNEFIVYNTIDVITSRELSCGYEQYKEEMERHRPDEHRHGDIDARANMCFEVEVNLAADYSMVQKYGSVSGAENHNLGVLNNVKTNYDDEFADELRMILNEQWISSCSTCDPWSSSTDSGVLLNSFTSWATGGFTTAHDVASLWTNRNFNGSTIGLAWVGTVCTYYKYNVLQDFSSDGDLKRCMQAHEIGHNFNADHSPNGIMAPSVSHANFWHSNSKYEIENFYAGIYCLSTCISNNAPVANFSYQIIEQCYPVQVQFTNESTFASSYNWTFEGGYPASSTQENPLIFYYSPGTYSVTLTAYNGGQQDTKVLSITIDGIESPTADFTYDVDGRTVSFYESGAGGLSYQWDFGDGNFDFYQQNPIHTYASNGVYLVTLTVYNDCGQQTISYYVEILVEPEVDFTASVNSGCNPLTVNFLNLSKDGDTYLWTFPGGTPATSTDENPVVVYNLAGSYDVTLDVTNGAGTVTKTETSLIVVSESPIPGFSYLANGSQVAFTDTSSYGTGYSWSFGDGTTSSDKNPTHNYADNGTYVVVQTVSNSCANRTITDTIVIAIAPIPSFTSDFTDPICAGESVQFTSTSTYGPSSYLWEFEGGLPATSSEANPLVQYNIGGTFKVKLTVTNANGSNAVELNNYIIVEPKPSVSFTFRADGLKLDFFQNISGSNNFNWNFGDGATSTETDPSHTFAQEGVYVVTLTAENRCGITEYVREIEVLLLPTADFNAQEVVICPGETVAFENFSSPSATSWAWTFEGGTPATSTDENPVVTYANSGKYNVSLTVTNSSGQGTTTKEDFVIVLDPVTASFTGQVSGNEIELTNTGSSGSSASWEIFNDEFSESLIGDNPTFVAKKNGVYNVVLTNSNKCGDAVSDTVQFVINAYPDASFTANGGGILCSNTSIQFAGQGGDTYYWEFEGGVPATSSDANPEVRYTAPGSYKVLLVATNSFGSDTIISTVHVTTVPKADFDFTAKDGTVQFTMTGSGQSVQFWDFGDNGTSEALNPEHTYTKSGEYIVTLIVSNGCGNDTITKAVGITVGVADLIAEYGIKVYPNPANEFVQIQMSKAMTESYTVQLMNTAGQVIKEKLVLNDANDHVSLDIQEVEGGLYILNIKTSKAVIPYKIFIVR